jgi:hypothetical protein
MALKLIGRRANIKIVENHENPKIRKLAAEILENNKWLI